MVKYIKLWLLVSLVYLSLGRLSYQAIWQTCIEYIFSSCTDIVIRIHFDLFSNIVD